MNEAEILWTPKEEDLNETNLAAFAEFINAKYELSLSSYDDIYQFSVSRVAEFWDGVWDFYGVVGDRSQLRQVLSTKVVDEARWYEGATCNYAENVFRGFVDSDAAVYSLGETRPELRRDTIKEVAQEVRRVAELLSVLGVGKGDRVCGYLPNTPESLVSFLACASLGAIWSCCSPEFGVVSVVDRFAQIEPKVLLGVEGYVYSGKRINRMEELSQIAGGLPTLKALVVVSYLNEASDTRDLAGVRTVSYKEDPGSGRPLSFEAVEFSHPLWIVYSSGTTGLPKPIVQSHGGIVLEHLKVIGLNNNLGPGSRFFWYTSTGWMMWNFLIGGLLVGSDIVLYDGSPASPDLGRLWRLVEEVGVTYFGTSAPFINSCQKAGLVPRELADLSSLKTLGSTGAPLSEEGFEWVSQAVRSDIPTVSTSGGTDLCTAVLGSSPYHRIFKGRLSAPCLGAKVESFNASGVPVLQEVGELVITVPMPSMPVGFWGDSDGSRYKSSYFDVYPHVWRHGDWITMYEDGSSVIHGRSDSTLNRSGVRMGTAEFYRVIESIPGVRDSLVIDTTHAETDGELICFVVLSDSLVDLRWLREEIRRRVSDDLSPRHVPDRVEVVAEIPRTLNGKKLEVPIRRLLLGEPLGKVVNLGAVANPEAIDAFLSVHSKVRS